MAKVGEKNKKTNSVKNNTGNTEVKKKTGRPPKYGEKPPITNPKAKGIRKYAIDPLEISKKQKEILEKKREENKEKKKPFPPLNYKKIDKEQFENLCRLQCTLLEMCDWFDCDDVTLNSWCKRTYNKSFSEVFKLKRGKGQISLRRLQFQLAENNAAMAIFLGKNYLGQSDKIEQTIEGGQNEIKINVVRAEKK